MEFRTFKLTLTFPPNYPLQPPSVKFLSEMFHPNISPDGRVALTNWSPAHDVTKILTDIQSLLSQPQLDSPLNQEATQLYRQNRRGYKKRVEQIIEKSSSEKKNKNESSLPEDIPDSFLTELNEDKDISTEAFSGLLKKHNTYLDMNMKKLEGDLQKTAIGWKMVQELQRRNQE